MDIAEVTAVITAIGNHDEHTAAAVTPISAALILADKKVTCGAAGYAPRPTARPSISTTGSTTPLWTPPLTVARERKRITLCLRIDTGICAVMDYFEIFLTRMTLCRSAAAHLGLDFELIINETRML